MRHTRFSTALVAAAAVSCGLVSPVASATEANELSTAPSVTAQKSEGANTEGTTDNTGDNNTGNDNTGDDNTPQDNKKTDSLFGSSKETSQKFETVMSWVSVVGAVLAAITQATVMIAQINPAILNPIKDLLRQAGIKI